MAWLACVTRWPTRVVPTNRLNHFETAFDHAKALADGFIVPKQGFDDLYDSCAADQKDAEHVLHEYLADMRSKLDCRQVMFVEKGKNAFQLEIPESRVGRSGGGGGGKKKKKKGSGPNKLPSDVDWQFKGSRNGWERCVCALCVACGMCVDR